VRTKAEILNYLKSSFARLPLKSAEATRLALVVESFMHAYDH